MTNFVPGPALALRGRDKKNNKKGNNEEEDDEGMDDDEGKFNSMKRPVLGIRDILVRIRIRGSVPGTVPLFFSDFKDAKKIVFILNFFFFILFIITYPQAHYLQSEKLIFLLEF
jgi:hypothetical protein